MLNLQSSPDRRRSPRRWLALPLIAAIGGVCGYFVGGWAFDNLPAINEVFGPVGWSDLVALGLGLIMVIAAILTGVRSYSPMGAGRLLLLDGPADAGEMRAMRRQALVVGLSGVILFLPFAMSAVGMPALPALGVIIALLAGHTVLNVRVYRDGDEMLRSIITQSAVVTFWAGQGLLFLWAASERLGVTPALTAWDIYVCLMAIYLGVSAVVTARRGLA